MMPGPDRNLVLAGRASRYAEASPVAGLRQHFQCAWACAFDRSPDREIIVVPDGAADLIWRDDRLSVAGPDAVAARPAIKPGSVVLGLRFAPGGAARWFGIDVEAIVGREVPLDDLWGRRAVEIAERIGEAATQEQRLACLQSQLAIEAASVAPPQRDAAMIFAVLERGTSEASTIRTLRQRLGLSERTLRRRCRHLFGYGPKTLDRILRFRRFHTMAFDHAEADLAGLALRAGYCDQAHMNREVRALSGLTPRAFVRQVRA